MDLFTYYDIILYDVAILELSLLYFVYHRILKNLKVKAAFAYMPLIAAFLIIADPTIRTFVYTIGVSPSLKIMARNFAMLTHFIGAVLVIVPYYQLRRKRV